MENEMVLTNNTINYENVYDIKNNWKSHKRYTRHSLHKMCSRICSFPPDLARFFIENYSSPGDVCLDVFSGKGTLPLEAILNERYGIGNDLSPEAYILTKAKCNPPKLKDIYSFLEKVKKNMGFLDSAKGAGRDIRTFFDNKTLIQIMELKELLSESDGKNSVFVKALICGIIHGSTTFSLSLPCSHSYSMSPRYVRKYTKVHGLKKPHRDVISCLKAKTKLVLEDPMPKIRGSAYNDDSRKLSLDDECVDMILTSPPYFDVQTYAYDNWLRLWFLGYDYKDVAKRLVQTGDEKKYEKFMFDSLSEMHRVMKDGKRCFIVVGDVKKRYERRKEPYEKIINTAEFLANPASEAGFKVEMIINDNIPQANKVLNSSLRSSGITVERILCLKK